MSIKEKIREIEGPDMKENMQDQIRQWFIECRLVLQSHLFKIFIFYQEKFEHVVKACKAILFKFLEIVPF